MHKAIIDCLIHRIRLAQRNPGALVPFRDLRQLYPLLLDKREFDRLILAAARTGQIALHATDYAAACTTDELADYVFRPDETAGGCGNHPRGQYYIGCTIRYDF